MARKVNLVEFNTLFSSFISRTLPAGIVQHGTGLIYMYKFSGGSWATDVEVTYDTDSKEIKVGWSSTHRSPSQAVAALAHYREAVEFACKLEAFLMDYEVVE